jgi:uncharacterized protein (DUF2062 family)
LTAVPLYWFCWWVGAKILGTSEESVDPDALAERLDEAKVGTGDWTTDMWTAAFWEDAFTTLASMGTELWLGSVILGVVTGLIGYFLTLWGVRILRRARGPRHSSV